MGNSQHGLVDTSRVGWIDAVYSGPIVCCRSFPSSDRGTSAHHSSLAIMQPCCHFLFHHPLSHTTVWGAPRYPGAKISNSGDNWAGAGGRCDGHIAAKGASRGLAIGKLENPLAACPQPISPAEMADPASSEFRLSLSLSLTGGTRSSPLSLAGNMQL